MTMHKKHKLSRNVSLLAGLILCTSWGYASTVLKDDEILFNSLKGLWYVDTYHTHWATPSCSCEAQLLHKNNIPETFKDYPYRHTRFCINQDEAQKYKSLRRRAASAILKTNVVKATYSLPIKVDTETSEGEKIKNHWLLSLINFTNELPEFIRKIAPEGIDLNFHVLWDKNGNLHCLSNTAKDTLHNGKGAEGISCSDSVMDSYQVNQVLVGDNPSPKSDFVMLLSRQPNENQQVHDEAITITNTIYQPETTNPYIGKNMVKNYNQTNNETHKKCLNTLNDYILEKLSKNEIFMESEDKKQLINQLKKQ
jgi:hypothetical protein